LLGYIEEGRAGVGGAFVGAEGAEILGRQEKWKEITCWKWKV